jgi:hypothetical protein
MKRIVMAVIGLFLINGFVFSQEVATPSGIEVKKVEVPIVRPTTCTDESTYSMWLCDKWDFSDLPEGVMSFRFDKGIDGVSVYDLKGQLIRSGEISVMDAGASQIVEEKKDRTLYDFNVLYSTVPGKTVHLVESGIFSDYEFALQVMNENKKVLKNNGGSVLASSIVTLRHGAKTYIMSGQNAERAFFANAEDDIYFYVIFYLK